jgi:hypothetical protein
LKKIFTIAFCLFYLVSSSGLAINFHYCGGKLKAIGINQYKEEACCGKKMKSKGCCQNKTSVVKAFGDQASSKNITITKALSGFVTVLTADPYFYPNPVRKLQLAPRIKAPPETPGMPTFLSTRSIRI